MLAVMDVIPRSSQRRAGSHCTSSVCYCELPAAGSTRWAACLGWLHDAGFEPPERHRLAAQVQAVLLVARKPTDG